MQEYQYQPLNADLEEIRLIELMPGSFEQDICFRIYNAPLLPPVVKRPDSRIALEELQRALPDDWIVRKTLDDRYMFCPGSDRLRSWNHPDPGFDHTLYDIEKRGEILEYRTIYEALSYTWGDPQDTVAAYIQDSSTDLITINITANLASALKHLRLAQSNRVLWVDALCINQMDIPERNSQVQRMDQIYRYAKSVVVWLGERTDGSDQAFSTIEHFSRQIEITQQNTIGEAPEAEEPQWWNPGVPLPYSEAIWNSLVAVLQRPWFTRIWVVQEAHLGGIRTTVQCGRSSVPWTAFIKLITILSNKTMLPQGIPGLTKALSLIKPSITELGDITDFPRLLSAVCHRQCMDPRDKIYGILGILSDCISSEIEPNYRSSVMEVYKHAVLTDIAICKRINMLQSCNIDLRLSDGPSWIPNWASLDGRQQLPTYFGGIGRIILDCSGCKTARYVHSNVLEVLGKQCGQVLSISAPASATAEGQLCAFLEVAPADLDREYKAGGSLQDAFINIDSLGRVKGKFPHSVLYPSMADLRATYRAINPFSHQNLDCQAREDDHLQGQTFISTREGYIGATLCGAQSGDIICVILGVDNPMLLRPSTNGSFLVVGACFVHGLMNAEAVLGPLPDEWSYILTRDRGYPENSCAFINNATGEQTKEDPRLPPLSSPWKRTPNGFKNDETGEIVTGDPRLTPEALMERCPLLTTLRLI